MFKKGRNSKNIYLSQADQREYMKNLRTAAEAGDVNAMGWMVFLSKQSTLEPVRGSGGFASGWVGDDQDPKEQILSVIRQNDPKSEQLPENKGSTSE